MTFPSWPEEPGPPLRPEPPDYPYPPLRPMPKREGPVMVPVVDVPRDLADRRRILLSGRLDAETATRVSAELMELDGRSADPVELVINSDGGPLGDVLRLLDVVGLMRAPVRTMCVGRAMGTAAVLLSCGTGGRRSAPHALISLRCAERERLEGSPESLRAQLEELDLVRRHVVAALAAATGRATDALAGELDHGSILDRQQAAAAGIIDPPER
jgi:ATP-dependent Clp protease protease subunit